MKRYPLLLALLFCLSVVHVTAQEDSSPQNSPEDTRQPLSLAVLDLQTGAGPTRRVYRPGESVSGRLARLKAGIAVLEKRLGDLQKSGVRQEEQQDSRISGLEDRQRDEQDKQESLASQASALESRLAGLEKQMKALDGGLRAMPDQAKGISRTEILWWVWLPLALFLTFGWFFWKRMQRSEP
jgi:hypothetical protein